MIGATKDYSNSFDVWDEYGQKMEEHEEYSYHKDVIIIFDLQLKALIFLSDNPHYAERFQRNYIDTRVACIKKFFEPEHHNYQIYLIGLNFVKAVHKLKPKFLPAAQYIFNQLLQNGYYQTEGGVTTRSDNGDINQDRFFQFYQECQGADAPVAGQSPSP